MINLKKYKIIRKKDGLYCKECKQKITSLKIGGLEYLTYIPNIDSSPNGDVLTLDFDDNDNSMTDYYLVCGNCGEQIGELEDNEQEIIELLKEIHET